MNTKRPGLVALALAIAVSMLVLPTLAGKPGGPPDKGGGGGTSYKIIKLDDVGETLGGAAFDINQGRLIVGVVNDSLSGEDIARAAYWTVTEVGRSIESTLHFLDDGNLTHTIALGCNEAGEIVGAGGVAQTDAEAVYWTDRQSAVLRLPVPAELPRSGAEAISNDGVICGWTGSFVDSEGRITAHALVWRVSEADVWGPLVLETLDPDPDGKDFVIAYGVSDHIDGVVTIAGESNDNAVRWTVTLAEDGGLVADSATILSAVGGATGVNNLGVVCGNADLDPGYPVEAAIWIGGIPLILDPGRWQGYCHPNDINDNGVVVGYASLTDAVVWPSSDAAMVPLNKFLKNSPFDSLSIAYAVSESGEIVGQGWINETSFRPAFLAIPK